MMQYCFELKKAKCLFSSCCSYTSYQKENITINIFFLIILVLAGLAICLYIFNTKKNRNENFDQRNNSYNQPTINLFGKNLNVTQMEYIMDNRGNLTDRFCMFTYISNIIIIFLNILICYLLLGKFLEILSVFNELNYDQSFIKNEFNFDKNVIKDDREIPQKIINLSLNCLLLIISLTLFNLDSEFIDHNKKNIFTVLFFVYYLYDCINVYSTKEILLYESYLIYSIVSMLIIIMVLIYSIYINKIFFTKLSKIILIY